MKVLSSEYFLIDTNKPFDSLKLEIDREDSCVIYNEFMDKTSVVDYLLNPLKAISGKLLYYGDNLLEYSRDEIKEWKERDVSYIDDFNDLMLDFDCISNIKYPMLLNRYEIDEKYLSELIKIFKIDKTKNIESLSTLDLLRIKIVRSLLNKPFLILVKDITKSLDEDSKDEILKELNSYNSRYKVPIIHETIDESILKAGSIRYLITSDGFVGSE